MIAGEKPSRWRVTHHLRRFEDPLEISGCAANVIDGIMLDIMRAEREKELAHRKELGLPHAERYGLKWCLPEEATHVELVAVCGAIAPLSECTKVGVVQWDAAHIAEEKHNAAEIVPSLNERGPIWRWD